MSRTTSCIFAAIVMTTMAIAAISKLVDLPAFEAALRTWELLPWWTLPWLTVVIPLAELLLAGLWLSRTAPRFSYWAVSALLTVFTLLFISHLLMGKPPSCACFGRLLRFEHQQSEAYWSIGRNVLLLAMLWAGYKSTHQRERPSHDPLFDIRPFPGVHGQSSGFTLLETVLVVALIGILVSLFMPALSQSRREARRVMTLSNLRSHASIVSSYVGDFSDGFPFVTNPQATFTVLRHPAGFVAPVRYFAAFDCWHWPLLDGYYEGQSPARLFVDPAESDRENKWPFTNYYYSATFLARPEYWNEYTRTGPKQWGPTYLRDVNFPSLKGLFVNNRTLFAGPDESGSRRQRIDIGFVDASARAMPYPDLTAPYPKGEGPWPGAWTGHGIRVLHTIDGVRGRDVK